MVVETTQTKKGCMKNRILILGAYGMLGHALQNIFSEAILKGHDLDITDERAIKGFIEDVHPSIVINAAGYTNVDGCEENQKLAFAVNGESLQYISCACNEVDAILIHYSTDYIFDGTKKEYVETDIPNPINIYGKSKLLGEKNIIKNIENYRIIRTSGLFGEHGKNFVDTIITLSVQLPEVKVVNDQTTKPTYTIDLAKKTLEIISLNSGIYHSTNDGICTWCEFASDFISNAVPCTAAEFPRTAKRPQYSVLTNTKTTQLRHWKLALNEYLMNKKTHTTGCPR
jgi:dTDP-4-dehydrorhamnose reductase